VAISDLLHMDVATGWMSEMLQFVTQPVSNTLADLSAYAGLSREELFPAPGAPPELTIRSRWRVPGLISEDWIFRSQHEPIEPNFRRRYEREYGATHMVYARRVRPESISPRPRLLYLHGYMQPETYLEEFAVLSTLALALDVEVIQLQPPYHGRRTPQGVWVGGEMFMTADLVRSVEALRQSLLDTRTLLSLLLRDDPRPVGVAGLSLGGALTLGVTCVEDRFAFSMPLFAHMDLEALVADVPVLRKMRRDLRSFGWRREDFRGFVQSLGWDELLPQLPAERVMMVAASEDRFFDPAVVTRMWQRWGKPTIHWYPCSHMGFLAHATKVVPLMKQHIENCLALDAS